MPNRILREGILTSEAVNSLSWQEEIFYRRLMSVVDDFGRYYASPKLLRAACYPLHIDKVSDADIGKWLTVCVTAALVSVYPAQDGKRYLELVNFKQQVRAKDSKFPSAELQAIDVCAADAKQVHSNRNHLPASAHLDVFGDGDVFGDEISKLSLAPALPAEDRPVLVLGEGSPKPTAKLAPPDCPHMAVLALWAEVLPALPQHLPSQWRGTRSDHLRARWRETAVAERWSDVQQGIEYLRNLFGFIGQSAFLTGKTNSRDPSKRSFVIELEWLVNPTNWAKVHEGKYHQETAA